MRLSEVIGHAPEIEALRQAYARDAVHHAYLLTGPDGIGKRGVARAFAALVNCTGATPGDACGACKSCRRMLSDPPNHPDLMLLEPDGKQIKIAQVRELLRVVPFPPIEARHRVVLIEPADALGEEAANALLKTLEEPASRTRFILVTSRPDALLTTIVSRCQRMIFGRLTDDEVKRGLVERHGVEPAVARNVTSLADGSLGAALALLEDPVMRDRDALISRLLAIAPGDTVAAFALAADLTDLKPALPTVFEVLSRLYRDLLLLRTGTAAVGLSNPDLAAPLAAAAERLGVEAILQRLELIADTRYGLLERNLNPRLSLERLIGALTSAAGDEGIFVQARRAV